MKSLLLNTLIAFVFLFTACNSSSDSKKTSNRNDFKDYISNTTSGIISKKSDIQILLTTPVADWVNNTEIDDAFFDISPEVDGKWMALNSRTISFQPEKELAQDTEYVVNIHLDKFQKTEKGFESFSFKFRTIKQDFIVTTNNLESYDRDWQFLTGNIKASDVIVPENAKKLVRATQDGKQLKVKLDFITSESNFFTFTIDSIQRFKEDSEIEISYDGSPINVNQKETIPFTIVGKDNFKVIDIAVINDEKQYLEINFTDPLKKDQNLNGLIDIKGAKKLKYAVNGNVLKVYPSNTLKGVATVDIFQGLTNIYDFKLKKAYSQQIAFEQQKPEVKLLQNGTILPVSENLKYNFESINLKAVDVTVFKIFENNVLQFLQTNNLSGNNNLKQVARPVAKKTINLQKRTTSNLGKWNAFSIDLKQLIATEPGAIYRLEFSFKKSYSLYKCETSSGEETEENIDYDNEEVEDSYWDMGGYYNDNYDNDYDYSWRERDNPCNHSYYRNKKVKANILASNIGVTVKKGINHSYLIATNDILTSQPMGSVKVSLYNYQQQIIETKSTDEAGLILFDLNKPAYFALVTKGNQTTYVKLNDGNTLSLSKYDVSGVKLTKGLKGFIYGERGVWRPGDTVHLSFMLNDNSNKLPVGHPVKLELTDPYGTIIHREIQTEGLNNLYRFSIDTDDNATTGNWNAKVSVGGATFSKTVKIETIKPNRLKIKVGFDAEIISTGKAVDGNLSVKWLHGAIARNLKTDINAKFKTTSTRFKNFPDYHFEDPARIFNSEEIPVYEGLINNEGLASFTINPELTSKAPGMLKATFITKVYENGGDVSTDVFSSTYSPYTSYVGLSTPKGDRSRNMLLTDVDHRFDIVTVDEKGRPKAIKNLEVKIYKVNRSWWWNASDANLSQYNGNSYKQTVFTKTISSQSNGKATFNFKLKYPDWGRFLVRVVNPESGHATGKMVFIDWPGWAGKARKGNPSDAVMLIFKADKDKYNVGEKAKVSFPSVANGNALVTIENGTEVIESFWVPTTKGETKFDFEITKDMTPNVYISISALQKHANTENDLPIRTYGVTGIIVEDANTVLQPKIQLPKVIEPEQKVAVTVSETSGKAMTYTIAMVDEGLLDLTRFKTPNPHQTFFAKEALGVKTWDVFDDIIGAYGGRINQVFSIGGDGMLSGGKSKKANRFKPMVVYLGPFYLDKNQTKTHQINIPKYIGSVRTMVVAHNPDSDAYGKTEVTTPVRKPLMVLASLPRKVTPGEKVTLPVTVFAMDKKVKNVSVKLKHNKQFKVTGNATQKLHFEQPDEKMAYFNLEVLQNGIGTIEVVASGKGFKATYPVEIDAVNPNPETSEISDITIEGNSSQEITFSTFGVKGTNNASIEFSSLPPMNFDSRMQYLIKYPHGCVEQTTSGAFPQLFLNDIFDITADKKGTIQKNVKKGIDRLAHFQLSNGGLSYWPGSYSANDWGTSYAGHFLIEAEKKGYVLPFSFKTKWILYQKQTAKSWRYSESNNRTGLAQAYRLYTLALAKSPDLSSMNRLKETNNISIEAKYRLAAAYALIGQKEAAKSIVQTAKPTNEQTANYSYYGSAERNLALKLETLILLKDQPKAKEIGIQIAQALSSEKYMSTQTTSYCLLAMSKYAQYIGGTAIKLSYSANGKTKQEVNTSKTLAIRTLSIKEGANTITVQNKGSNTLFARVANKGILAVGQEKLVQRNLLATVLYKSKNGKKINPTQINQGTNFVAEITISNTKNTAIKDVALSSIFPSGWEIINTRFTDFGNYASNTVTHEDIRDDRANFYFDLKSRETKTVRVLLNASYLGDYYLPGVQCEAMYDDKFMVRTKGQWISVVK